MRIILNIQIKSWKCALNGFIWDGFVCETFCLFLLPMYFISAFYIFHIKSNILYACNGNRRCSRICNDNIPLYVFRSCILALPLPHPSPHPPFISPTLDFTYAFLIWLSWVWKSSCKLQIIHRFNGNAFIKDMPIPLTLDCVSAGKAICTNTWFFFVCLCIFMWIYMDGYAREYIDHEFK